MTTQEPQPAHNLEEHRLIAQRKAKMQALRDRGIDPYPARFGRTHTTAQARAEFQKLESSLPPPAVQDGAAAHDHRTVPVTVAGRVVARRGMGKASFLDLKDGAGRIQVHLRADVLGEAYSLLDDIDLGDFVGVTGPVFKTRRGEISIEAQKATMLSKALRPLPEKWHGLTDTEQRFRQRYLDLVSNDRAMELAVIRAKIVQSMRSFLHARGFIEVETPILVPVAAGAMARPFTTHYNAIDRNVYLRIATELNLKRLIVGGVDKVFEIGRVFRNEGVDHDHNPEFTTLESYEAYADYQDVMRMVEEMVAHIAREVTGTTLIKSRQDGVPDIDLTPPWPRLDLRQEILKRTEIDIVKHRTAESLAAAMRAVGIHVEPGATKGRLLDKIISAEVEPKLIQPSFLVDYPVEMSPLAKRKAGTDGIVERFEAFAFGTEIANAFTELNDPIDQRARFEEQEQMRREGGDDEADRLDEDFLVAVEHGMPPTGGLGMGIDRLSMLLTGERSIREVILFPQLKT